MFQFIHRWRHRHGFGIHSPWAYELVRDALFEKLPYYAFDSIEEGSAADEQLYRFVCWLRPRSYIYAYHDRVRKEFVDAAWRSLRNYSNYTLYYYAYAFTQSLEYQWPGYQIPPNVCIVIDGIDMSPARDIWHQLLANPLATSSFEQPTRGIIFFDPAHQRQNYLL